MSAEVQPARLSGHDPRRAGPYRLTGRLGRGGQGTVYLGEDDAGARAAVKVLDIDVRHDVRARDRFLREIDAARRVASFCTAQILAVDVDGDPPYVASEFIPGRNLGEEIAHGGVLRGARLERLAISTVTALAAIHQAGVVHCDFKPGNVVCGPDGARVIDFGIARAAGERHTTLMGSPAFMAPERFSNADVGPPADMFAWAATIAYAAGGRPPFGDDSLMMIMQRVVHDPPDLTGLAAGLEGLLRDCLHKDPQGRPTAREALLRLVERNGAAIDSARLRDSVEQVTRQLVVPAAPAWRDAGGLLLAGLLGAAGAVVGGSLGGPAEAAGLGCAALGSSWIVRTLVAARWGR